MEIERKWLLRSLPPIIKSEIPDVQILQAYLPLIGYRGEARIRALTNPHTGEVEWKLAFKSQGSLTRQEFETSIPEWLFDSLQDLAKKQLLKTMTFISYSKYKLEFHVYTDIVLRGLIILECEFKSEHDANFFEPPDWLDSAKEDTNDTKYRNRKLAARGPPKK